MVSDVGISISTQARLAILQDESGMHEMLQNVAGDGDVRSNMGKEECWQTLLDSNW